MSSGSRARAEDLRVRLFSAVPPVEVEVISQHAAVRSCAQCKPLPIEGSIKIVATANVVHFFAGPEKPRKTAVLMISGTYRLKVNGSATMEINAPLEIRSDDGRLRIVARMPLEQYVAMAVGGEAGGIRSPEALKAIAVAIRTYAVKFRGRHSAEGFDLCDSTHCQVVRSSDTNTAWRSAAEETEGELLWYDGAPAYAYHHASCGGMLEDGRIMLGQAVPYLRRHADNVCAGPESQWDAQLDKAELRRALINAGFRLGTSHGIAVTDRDGSGRARRLLVAGAPVDATSFRMAIGRELGWNKVRSELYDVSDQGESVLFHGRGRGHGVGLCQTGADLRAQQGADYRQILAFYYPGTTLGVTAKGLHWIRMAGERIELQTTSEADRSLIDAGERMLRDTERRTGWTLRQKPLLRVYPSVPAFRDSTGEPGWVAASTVGRVIRMQPAPVLRAKGTLDETLRHELLHMLVEERARASTPVWFREGVVLWLTDAHPSRRNRFAAAGLEERFEHPKSAEELKSAYADAEATVAALVKKHGEQTVLGWLKDGMPR